jgi:hypothetical protein
MSRKTNPKSTILGQDLPWLTDGHTGKTILLSEMERNAIGLAKVLHGKGLKPGVTMVDRSRAEIPVLALAVWLYGAGFNTMDPNPNKSTQEGNLSSFLPKYTSHFLRLFKQTGTFLY